MNIKELHPQIKDISAQSLFNREMSSTMAIQSLKNGVLKEYFTKTPGLLHCINGKVV